MGAAAMAVALSQSPPDAIQSAPPRARRNVAHHYDLDERLYALFLDADRQYSCAYFEAPDQSLDDAQLAKKRHLAAKLLMPAATSACSTSAPAGAGWRSISPRSAARASPASRSRRSSSRWRACGGGAGLVRPGRVPAARLSRRDGDIRPHRLSRHVRACRHRFYDAFFGKCADIARRRRRHGAAFHRPLRRPGHHQPLDRQIHLPGRLYSGAVGGAAGGRARGPAHHRYRDPAPALRRDAQGVARALPRAARGGRAAL